MDGSRAIFKSGLRMPGICAGSGLLAIRNTRIFQDPMKPDSNTSSRTEPWEVTSDAEERKAKFWIRNGKFDICSCDNMNVASGMRRAQTLFIFLQPNADAFRKRARVTLTWTWWRRRRRWRMTSWATRRATSVCWARGGAGGVGGAPPSARHPTTACRTSSAAQTPGVRYVCVCVCACVHVFVVCVCTCVSVGVWGAFSWLFVHLCISLV